MAKPDFKLKTVCGKCGRFRVIVELDMEEGRRLCGECNSRRLETQSTIDRFNRVFAVGSKVLWRGNTIASFREVTVKSKAYEHHGVPVAFFEEISGCCSVEPRFMDYPRVSDEEGR